MNLLKTSLLPSKSPLRYFNHRKSFLNPRLTALGLLMLTAVYTLIILYRTHTGETELLNEVISLLGKQKLQRARRLVNSTLKKFPNSHSALYLKGIIELELKNYKEAQESFKEAIKNNPSQGDYYFGSFVALYHMGNLDEALKNLLKAEALLDESQLQELLRQSNLEGVTVLLRKTEDVHEGVYNTN